MSEPARKRRRWLRWILILLVLLVGAVAGAPWWVAPIARSRIVAALEERTGAEAELGTFSFAWPGHVALAALTLRDPGGLEHVRVERVTIDVQALAAIRGRFLASARVEGVRVRAEEDAEGRWSFEKLLEGGTGSSKTPRPGERAPSAPSDSGPPPYLKLELDLLDVVVDVQRPSGPLRLSLPEARLRVDGLDRPATFLASGELAGKGLPSGSLTLEGSAVARPASGELTADLRFQLALGGTGGLDARLEAHAEGTAASGTLDLDGRIAPLVALLGDALPLAEGTELDARLTAHATFSGSPDGGEAQASVDLREIAAHGPDGAPVDLAGLGDAHLEFEARADLAAGTAELARLDGRFGPVVLAGRGRARGLGSDALALDASRLTVDADLDALRAILLPILDLGETSFGGKLAVEIAAQGAGADLSLEGSIASRELTLGELAIDGEPLVLAATVRGTGSEAQLAGTLTCERLAVDLGGGRRVEERALTLELATALADPAARPTASARGAFGRIDLAHPTGDAATWRATLDLALARLVELGAGLGAPPGLTAAGRLTGTVDVTPAAAPEAPLAFAAQLSGKGLDVTLPVEGKAPARIQEPRFALEVRGRHDAPAGSLEVKSLTLDSATIRGTARGRVLGLGGGGGGEDPSAAPAPLELAGVVLDFAYVPDRLAAWIAPWLPGELTGAAEEPLHLTFDGRLDELGPELLVGPGAGSAHFGLGSLEVFGLRADGTLDVEKTAGATAVKGDLSANDGAILLRTRVGGDDPESGAEVHLELDAVRAAAGLAPALGLVHPAFAALEKGGDLSGVLDASLDLTWKGALPADLATLRLADLPLERISGTGRISLRQAVLEGSPFLGKALALLGDEAGKTFDLDELTFRIDRGRVHYDQPWTWSIAGVATRFAGSLGLDGSLDLDWQVPVTEALARKYPVLAPLAGRELSVPVRGSALSPRIEWSDMMQGAAKDALKAELERRTGTGDVVESIRDIADKGLGDLLGGDKTEKKEEPPVGDGEREPPELDRNDPAALLREADRLWDAGEKQEAAKLYDRIHDKFQISTTYLLNRDRIKERRKVKG